MGETTASSFVLIVEDDEFISAVYLKKLTKEGFDALCVSNGEEALKVMRERRPDLVLLDLIMPIKDGFQTLEEMQKDGKLKDIRVVVLSNLSHDEDVARTKALGALDYIVKANISLEDMVKKVREYIALPA
jgi:DNA-binding response OmpR family regulator